MGKVFVVADLNRDLALIGLLCHREAEFEITVAGSKNGNLAAPGNNVGQTGCKKIESFLVRQPGHRPEERHIL